MSKRNNSFGQSTIEYVAIITLVAAGIIIGGPYVIRSWNAQIKGWEDGIRESLTDKLPEADTGDFSGLVCTCSDWEPACATPPCCHLGGCDLLSRAEKRDCSILNCKTTFQCIPDDACCDVAGMQPVVPYKCGINATDITGVRADGQIGCEDGYYEMEIPCGDGTNNQYTCSTVQDLGICPLPHCIGSAHVGDSRYKGVCVDDDLNLGGISINYTYVKDGGCSVPVGSIPKCQVECKLPAVPVPTINPNRCDCPSGMVLIDGVCHCPEGTVFEDTSICLDTAHCIHDPAMCNIAGQCYR